MSELKLENVELCSDVMGDDELVIRKGNATYIPSTPELVEIARRCNSHDALTEHKRLLQLENEQLAKDNADLVDVITSLINYRGILTHGNALVIAAKEALEKHKCD